MEMLCLQSVSNCCKFRYEYFLRELLIMFHFSCKFLCKLLVTFEFISILGYVITIKLFNKHYLYNQKRLIINDIYPISKHQSCQRLCFGVSDETVCFSLKHFTQLPLCIILLEGLLPFCNEIY